MSNPGNRKQRYILDIDDVVKDGFMTKANAEALIRGVNGSGGVVKLGVPFGGTNNASFNDQELLKYDAITGKIVSAGFSGVLPGGNSIFIPRETGTIYANNGVDQINSSATEMVLASQSFSLPANSLWSDLMVTFQTQLNASFPSVGGLEVRLGNDATPPSGFFQPNKTLFWIAQVPGDNSSVTWLGMGQIPLARAFDDPLVVNLYGAPQDIISYRTVITRASYRGLQPEPAAGGQKGIPIFLNPSYVFYAGVGATGWTTVDVSSRVPEGASAVMINTFARSNEQGGGSRNIKYRPQAGGGEYLLVSCQTNNDEDDIDTDTTQMILPFNTSGSVRSFQYLVEAYFNGGTNIVLTGYIT